MSMQCSVVRVAMVVGCVRSEEWSDGVCSVSGESGESCDWGGGGCTTCLHAM